MRPHETEEGLKKKLRKLAKKDPVMWNAVYKKVKELKTCEDPNSYKNLESPLQPFKRIHITGSYILIFKYDQEQDLIKLYDFDHWDNIYKNLRNKV